MTTFPMPESPAEAHQLLRAALLNYLYLLRTYRAVAAQVGATSTEAANRWRDQSQARMQARWLQQWRAQIG